MKLINYCGDGWKRGSRPVSTIPIHRALCLTLKSLTDFTRQRNRGKVVGFGRDRVPWERVMGQGKGPVCRRPGSVGVNIKHRGERGVKTPGMGTR